MVGITSSGRDCLRSFAMACTALAEARAECSRLQGQVDEARGELEAHSRRQGSAADGLEEMRRRYEGRIADLEREHADRYGRGLF